MMQAVVYACEVIMATYYIYHIPGVKVGCTRNLAERKRHYPPELAKTLEVLRVLENVTAEQAGDHELIMARRYRYMRHQVHYSWSVKMLDAIPPDKAREGRRLGGLRRAGWRKNSKAGDPE
jgi:hypothetical protein